jgi:hypothetical protein
MIWAGTSNDTVVPFTFAVLLLIGSVMDGARLCACKGLVAASQFSVKSQSFKDALKRAKVLSFTICARRI